MPSYEPVIKNGAAGAIFYMALKDQSVPGAFKAAPTLAAGDFKISIDGGALANLATLPAVTPAAGVEVKFTLSQAETNGDNLTIQCIDQTNPKEWVDTLIRIQTTAVQFDTIPTANQNADALLDRVDGVEPGLTFRQWLRLGAAVLFGKAAGMATTTATFRNTPDTKNRVTATVDADGNRSAVTLDPS